MGHHPPHTRLHSEACDFRDHHGELKAAGADQVYGLSSQHTAFQRELLARLRLLFAMLADPALDLARLLGLPTFTASGMTLYKRLTLIIISGGGVVVERFFYPVSRPRGCAAPASTRPAMGVVGDADP